MVVAGRPSGTALTPRRFPPPWTAEFTPNCFIVCDVNGQALSYIYFECEPGRRSAAKLLREDEASFNVTRVTSPMQVARWFDVVICSDGAEMTITTQTSTNTETTKTSTGSAVVNNDIALLALFRVLSLLASFYIMTHFPLSAEDAGFLSAWL